MADPITPTEFARRKGVAGPVVFQALKSGRLSSVLVGRRRLLDPDVAEREWLSRVDVYQSERNNGQDVTLTDARTRTERARAEMLELELAEKRGEVRPMAEQEAFWSGLTEIFRARMMVLPQIVAPLVVGKPIAEVKAIIQQHVYEALAELANDGQLPSH